MNLILLLGGNRFILYWCFGYVFVALTSNAFANPIRSGCKDVDNLRIVREMRAIGALDTTAVWCSSLPFPMSNIALIAGVPCINCTNIYPDLDRWHVVDPGHENEPVYNRYAHILISMKEYGDAEFSVVSPDSFRVALTVDHLRQLGVRYLLVGEPFSEEMLRHGISLVKDGGGWLIYQVEEECCR